jgi:ankyrin repeat protein
MEPSQEHKGAGAEMASPERANERAQSELMVACAAGKLADVKRLLTAGVDPNHVNAFGETPLTYAVAARRSSVVYHLLSKGADVELPPRPAWSPLMYAAATGNQHVAAALLHYGADVLRRDAEGRSPIELARSAGHFKCAAFLELRSIFAVVLDEVRRPEPVLRTRGNSEGSLSARYPMLRNGARSLMAG